MHSTVLSWNLIQHLIFICLREREPKFSSLLRVHKGWESWSKNASCSWVQLHGHKMNVKCALYPEGVTVLQSALRDVAVSHGY